MTNWKIPYFRHDLGQDELDAVAEVLAGDILTTGETTERFEAEFSAYLGRRYALGTMSCTGAMHMALLALGVGPGDEVITTPMSFLATATAIIEAGATPIFVDVESDTANMDAGQVESAITERTKAILPVHLYGQMCDMTALRSIADRHDLYIIEDAAHCIEGRRDGIRPGDLSEAACFSFYATKNIACGEGGAVVCDDGALRERLFLLSTHGMNKTARDRDRDGYSPWDMVALGWKYNMSNILAAILLPQMGRLEMNLARRHALASRYKERLAEISGIRIPVTRPNTGHARHVFTVWIEGFDRNLVVERLNRAGIGAVVNYPPIHLTSYFVRTYGHETGQFPNAEQIGNTTVSLPFYPNMPDKHVDVVADTIGQILGSE